MLSWAGTPCTATRTLVHLIHPNAASEDAVELVHEDLEIEELFASWRFVGFVMDCEFMPVKLELRMHHFDVRVMLTDDRPCLLERLCFKL